MDSTVAMSIHLVMGSEVVLDSIHSVPIVSCDAGGYATTYHVTCGVMKSL